VDGNRQGEYVDTGWSGSKASRPEFDRLMRDAGKRVVDGILCWKLDRFGRSLLHCKTAIEQLRSYGVRFIATSQNIDTDESNPTSRFLPPGYLDSDNDLIFSCFQCL
jgi:DNA invertase Pin-like site-specific DNA recombinase